MELWRAAQKQVEIEQTETFDYKGNKGFEKRVKIHKTEYHEMQIQVKLLILYLFIEEKVVYV